MEISEVIVVIKISLDFIAEILGCEKALFHNKL